MSRHITCMQQGLQRDWFSLAYVPGKVVPRALLLGSLSPCKGIWHFSQELLESFSISLEMQPINRELLPFLF